MNNKLKMKKFHMSDSGFMQIRYENLNGKVIAFGIAGTELSTLQFDGEIDFDKESDELIKEHRDSKNNMAFEYVPDDGFCEVNTTQQKWFIF